MTDSINALTVILASDMREDDAEPLIAAILQLRGVLRVDKHVADLGTHLAEMRARSALGDKLWEVLYPKPPKA